MEISFDPAKNDRNIRERGLSFERVMEFNFETAARFEDARRDYGERRLVALGYLDERLHALCFTEIVGGIRVISFRRANRREARKYAQAKALDR
ncbi:MAG: BrnT family toxin [Alphaproteobacteria bacterium]|nr:BrnT family toxin [Alphaproteobacteria bacterium]